MRKTKMRKKEINNKDNSSILIILPSCYGNFKRISTFCQDCDLKDDCRQILPPKEPLWCNSP
ncbi:MAG: hypothetical protein ACFFFB_13090 [Candidatus Heimdallarchaeota archaeon]